jgi:hypothetical protein
MPASLDEKRAYYARIRQANYTASLKLEGFDVPEGSGAKPLPSREELLKRYSTSTRTE